MSLFQTLRPLFVPTDSIYSKTLRSWRERIFSAIMTLASSAGLVVYLIMIYNQAQRRAWGLMGIYTAAYALLLIITFFKRFPFYVRVNLLNVMLYSIGIMASLESGTVGDGRVWFVAVPVLATVFIGGLAGLIGAAFSFITWIGIGALFAANMIPYNIQLVDNMVQPENINTFISTGATLLVTTLIFVGSISSILNHLDTTIIQSRELTDELEEKSTQLELQTQKLKKRSDILEFTAYVNRSLASILEPDQILLQAARHIREKFNLEHVYIFLLDETRSKLQLNISDGANTSRRLVPGRSIPLGMGLFSKIIETGLAQINVESQELTTPLEDLIPPTASYAAFPLGTRDRVQGIISMHSLAPTIFEPDDLLAVQILVDQIAVLLANAQLFAEREVALEAERRAYGQMSQEAWGTFIQKRVQQGYRRDQGGISTIGAENISNTGNDTNTRSFPIRLRGKIIGYVDAKKPSRTGEWNASEMNVLSTLSDRLESALDTARLYEETQQLAAQEKIISQATTRMRESLDIQNILKTATQEIAQSLGLEALEIQLGEVETLVNESND
jgi:GAF domain-containing protein